MKKKLLLSTLGIVLLGLLSILPVKSIGLTTGFTFTLNEPNPLEHVYVPVGGPGGLGTFEDILLPSGIWAPGFAVPTGTSDFALEQTLSTDLMDVFAVIGTFTDGMETHLVVGTGEDLTGVYWGDVVTSILGLTFASLIATLESGTMPDLLYIVEDLHTGGHMAPLGSTIQLYFFSDPGGQPLDANVISNQFGNPEPPDFFVIPEVPLGTVMALVSMIIGLGAYIAIPRSRLGQKYLH